MPGPFDDLLRAAAGTSQSAQLLLPAASRAAGSELSEFLPTDADVLQRVEERSEDKSLFFELLEIPDEFLFGQSLKGLLAGRGEEGVGDNFEEFFRKLPPFQLIDGVFGTNITGKDVRFSDVRRNLLGERDVDEGFDQFLINLTGELLTSPFELLLTPFAKVGAVKGSLKSLTAIGGQGAKQIRNARAAAKYAGNFGNIAGSPEAALALSNAVDLGQRALFTFKIPWTDAGFVIQPWKSFDLQVARGLEALGGLANTLPGFKQAMRAFNRTHVALRSAEERAFVREGIRKGDVAEASFFQPFSKFFAQNARKHPELMREYDSQQVVVMMAELGIGRTDSVAMIETAIRNPGWAQARAKMKFLRRNNPDFRRLHDAALEGDAGAIQKLYDEFPDVPVDPLRPSLIKDARLALRPGIDVPADVRQFPLDPIDVQISDTLGEAAGEGVQARAAVARERAGTAKAKVKDADQKALDMFRRVREAKGDQRVKEYQQLVDASTAMMEQVGLADVGAGLMNMLTVGYFPRELGPVANLIDRQFRRKIKSRFGSAGLNAAETFMKGRVVTDLTTWEANQVFWELGNKFTAHQPIKEFVEKGAPEGIHRVTAEIFDDRFSRRLRKLARKGGGEAAHRAADFFQTNPMLAWYRRVEKSSRQHGRLALVDHVLDADSPLALERLTIGDPRVLELVSPNNEYGTPLKLLTVNKGGFKLAQQDPSTLTSLAIGSDNAAKIAVARGNLFDDINRRVLDEGANINDVLRNYQDTVSLDRPGVAASDLRPVGGSDPDRWHMAAMKSDLSRLQEMRAREKALRRQGGEIRTGRGRGVQPAKGEKARLAELAQDARGEISELRTRIDNRKQALRGTVTSLREVRDQLADAIKTSGKDQNATLRELLQGELLPAEVQELVLLRNIQKERGVTALDELLNSENPKLVGLGKKLIDRQPGTEVVAMYPEVFDGVFGPTGVLETLRKPDKLGALLKLPDFVANWWKAWTILPPVFLQTRLRDFVSNIYLLGMGGANPKHMAGASGDAWRVTRAMGRVLSRKDPEALTRLTLSRRLANGEVQSIKGSEFIEQMQKRGLWDSSAVRDSVIMSAEDSLRFLEGYKPGTFFKDIFKGVVPSRRLGTAADNPIIQSGFRFASFGDNYSKAIGVLADWRGGKSLTDAIESTRLWSYDPSKGLTAFERHAMRRVIPFYSFMAFAVKRMTSAYFSKPSTVTAWKKLYDVANSSTGVVPAEFDAVIPQFIRDNLGIPFKMSRDGPKYLMMGNYVPQGGLARFVNSIEDSFDPEKPGGLGTMFMENVRPDARVLIENFLNTSYHTKQAIERYPGEQVVFMGKSMTKKQANWLRQISLFNDLDRLGIMNHGDVEKAEGLAALRAAPPPGKRRELSFGEKLITGRFGVAPRGYLVDVEDQSRFAEFDHRQAQSKLLGQLRKLNIDLGKPGRGEGMAALKELLTDEAATGRFLDMLRERFEIDPKTGLRRDRVR